MVRQMSEFELALLLVVGEVRVPVPHATQPKGSTKLVNLLLGILTEQLQFLLPLTARSYSIDSFHTPLQEDCHPGAPRLEKRHPVRFQKCVGMSTKKEPTGRCNLHMFLG